MIGPRTDELVIAGLFADRRHPDAEQVEHPAGTTAQHGEHHWPP